MAVEARHMNLCPQLLTNIEFMKTNQENPDMYDTQMDYSLFFAKTMPEAFPSLVCNPVSAKTSMKADSGLTCNLPAPRKRPRDSINEFNPFAVPQKHKFPGFSSVLDEDIVFQIQQQQSEIDRLVAEHTQKVRLELEELRKRQSRMLVSAIHERVVKKLKEKDEEVERVGKLNWVLQERVKSLFVENQIWRDLAQTNEATANSLRSNLEQVLAQVSEDRHTSGGAEAAAVADDAESSCGSSDYGRRCMLSVEGGVVGGGAGSGCDGGGSVSGSRMCRRCGEKESCVLLLPCRHLCVCTLCGSGLLTCPVCNSVMNASVRVNMS